MSRLQVGGLALILDSVDEEIIGEVVVITGHDGLPLVRMMGICITTGTLILMMNCVHCLTFASCH